MSNATTRTDQLLISPPQDLPRSAVAKPWCSPGLSSHDAGQDGADPVRPVRRMITCTLFQHRGARFRILDQSRAASATNCMEDQGCQHAARGRSEEHESELQSLMRIQYSVPGPKQKL